MKKLYFLAFLTVFLISCNNELIDFEEDNTSIPVSFNEDILLSRATEGPQPGEAISSGHANVPAPLENMIGIPVWIYTTAAGGENEMFITVPTGNSEELYLTDDPVKDQTKWIIEKIGSSQRPPAEDRSSISAYIRSVMAGNLGGYWDWKTKLVTSPPNSAPLLINRTYGTSVIIDNTDPAFYKISGKVIYLLDIPTRPRTFTDILRPDGPGSNKVGFATPADSYDEQWQIAPAEDLELVTIRYDFLRDDSFTVEPEEIKVYQLPNNTLDPITRDFTVSETVSEEVTYSKTTGYSLKIDVGVEGKAGIPLLTSGKLNTTISNTSSWNFTTGEKQTQSKTISSTDHITVRPGMTLIVRLVVVKYRCDITYIAQFKGKKTGRTYYYKGRWKSMLIGDESLSYTTVPNSEINSNPEIRAFVELCDPL